MFKKLWAHEYGQAAAEFGLALIVLMPLLFWILRFAELVNEKHKSIEAARYIVWESGYGRSRSDIRMRVNNMFSNASLFSPQGGLTVTPNAATRSTQGDFIFFSNSFLNVPQALGLRFNNHQRANVIVTDELMFGIPVTIRSQAGLITNPWHLHDRNNNSRLDDGDLKDAVYDLHMYPFTFLARRVFDVIGWLHNNRLMQWIAWFFGQAPPDVEPRGHTRLDDVPEPNR